MPDQEDRKKRVVQVINQIIQFGAVDPRSVASNIDLSCERAISRVDDDGSQHSEHGAAIVAGRDARGRYEGEYQPGAVYA